MEDVTVVLHILQLRYVRPSDRFYPREGPVLSLIISATDDRTIPGWQ